MLNSAPKTEGSHRAAERGVLGRVEDHATISDNLTDIAPPKSWRAYSLSRAILAHGSQGRRNLRCRGRPLYGAFRAFDQGSAYGMAGLDQILR
jgi:hypothetical protein